jgi:hypothetical protein
MTELLGWATIAKVAERFHGLIREELKERVREVDEINARQRECCATHLFTDPNDAFAEAFLEVVGREIDVRCGYDMGAYQVAWGLAKRRGFSRTWGLGR